MRWKLVIRAYYYTVMVDQCDALSTWEWITRATTSPLQPLGSPESSSIAQRNQYFPQQHVLKSHPLF